LATPSYISGRGIWEIEMAIRKSMQDDVVVSGDRVEWLEKCANALAASGFTKVTKNATVCQIEAAYRTWKVWGTILVTLTPVGSDTKNHDGFDC
jgi:hypothetical protein